MAIQKYKIGDNEIFDYELRWNQDDYFRFEGNIFRRIDKLKRNLMFDTIENIIKAQIADVVIAVV